MGSETEAAVTRCPMCRTRTSSNSYKETQGVRTRHARAPPVSSRAVQRVESVNSVHVTVPICFTIRKRVIQKPQKLLEHRRKSIGHPFAVVFDVFDDKRASCWCIHLSFLLCHLLYRASSHASWGLFVARCGLPRPQPRRPRRVRVGLAPSRLPLWPPPRGVCQPSPSFRRATSTGQQHRRAVAMMSRLPGCFIRSGTARPPPSSRCPPSSPRPSVWCGGRTQTPPAWTA